MFKIFLINMPFGALYSPSFALTQLKSVLDSKYKNLVSVEILYLNQDFARFIGIETARFMETSSEARNSGLGDWLFRQAAFPELNDNTEKYFQRYFPYRNKQTDMLKCSVQEKKQGLNQFLNGLIDTYKIDQAAIVGFTSMFNQNAASFAMARKLKERNSDIVIIMGGANCETPMGEEIVKNVEHIDFVFSGPALKSFPEFVQYCLNREIEKCNRINGVFSKKKPGSGELEANGLIGEELDIDIKVEIDYETFFNTLEKNFPGKKVKPNLFFETSRGCWWGERSHCSFCGLNGKTIKYRAMSPQKAIEQFESLFKYSGRCYEFQGVDNIMPKSYLQEVFPFLNPPPDASIFYEVRANLSGEDLRGLSRAGVKRVQPGIESLATGTLKLMKKGTAVFQNLLFLKNCVTYNIEPGWNLLVGFPGEGEEVYKKYVRDLPLLTHLPPPTGSYPVRFDRYSTYFVEAEKYGLDLRPYDFYELIYPFSKESIANMAYYFMDNNFGAEYFVTMVKWINKIREKIVWWQNRWSGKDKALPAKLYFKEKGNHNIIYDSRARDVIEHQVSETGRQVLEQLTSPGTISHIASELSRIPDFDPEKEIGFLHEKGLVFEENGRFMSLVLTEKPQESKLTEHS